MSEQYDTPEPLSQPTPEQIEAALGRVITDPETGRQTLDGYFFPPDNNDPFNPGLRRGGNANGTTLTFESSFPNSAARKENLRGAALGIGPLFIRPDDPEYIRVMKEHKFRLESRPGIVRRLIDRFFADDSDS